MKTLKQVIDAHKEYENVDYMNFLFQLFREMDYTETLTMFKVASDSIVSRYCDLHQEKKKQKAQKPIVKEGYCHCPKCGKDDFYLMYDNMNDEGNRYNYCANCGQKLDWSDYDE